MPFVNREQELDTLRQLYERPEGSLMILYGRRRIGKTALLQRFLSEHPGVYFLATEESEMQNLSYLRQLMADFMQNDLLREAVGIGWDRLMTVFSGMPGKKVLVIDEFQYLCHANAAFASVMQRLYDIILKPAGVMVILCGSYIRMMESQTLHYDSPLYGRRDGQIRLQPLSFRHFAAYHPAMDEDMLIQRYAVTGGVPRYMEMLAPEPDLEQAISRYILDTQSMLYEEPTFLLAHEVKEVGSYFTVLKSIAAGNRRPSAIAADMQIPQTSLSKLLAALLALDLIERCVPVTETNPEKSKKSLYRIKDHFLAFWFRFVYPYRSSLALRNQEQALAVIRRDFIVAHVSYVYERICAEKLEQMAAQGSFGAALSRIGNWWDPSEEIDIVGLGTDGTTLVLAECKYQTKPVGPSVLQSLREKGVRIAWGKGDGKERTIHCVLFSRSGFDRNLQAMAGTDPTVHLVERLLPDMV